METRNIFFAAACGALLGFTSCSQQEPPLDEAAAGPKTLTIKVGAETAGATRVTTADGLDLEWAPGDQIAVAGYGDDGLFRAVSVLTTSAGGSSSATATFTGTAITDATQYKVYFPVEAVDHTTGETRYQACLNELTASSAEDVKVILASDAVAGTGATIKATLKWESALLQISLENLPPELGTTALDKVNFVYETASGWSVDHPLKFTPSQTVHVPLTVYIPFIPDGGVKAGGTIRVSVYGGGECWDYSSISGLGKSHQKGFRYRLTAEPWMPYTGFTIGSTVWAETNVEGDGMDDDGGKFAANETDYGSFYQWGRNAAWDSSTPPLGVAMPDWDDTIPTGDNWNNGKGPCPSGWRMPTKDELIYFMSHLSSTWTTKSGIYGREFTNAGGHRLFLPAAGRRFYRDGSLSVQTFYGYYWSATPHHLADSDANMMYFYSNSIAVMSGLRTYGYSVRCVKE